MRQVYKFLLKSGVQMRLKMSQEEFTSRVKRGKLRLVNGEHATLVGSPSLTTGCYSSMWPLRSDCAGINPIQIPAQMAEDARVGVKIDYDPKTGEAIFQSAQQRKRWAEAHGMYVVTKKGTSSSMDPVRLDDREREIRAMAGRATRKCDD